MTTKGANTRPWKRWQIPRMMSRPKASSSRHQLIAETLQVDTLEFLVRRTWCALVLPWLEGVQTNQTVDNIVFEAFEKVFGPRLWRFNNTVKRKKKSPTSCAQVHVARSLLHPVRLKLHIFSVSFFQSSTSPKISKILMSEISHKEGVVSCVWMAPCPSTPKHLLGKRGSELLWTFVSLFAFAATADGREHVPGEPGIRWSLCHRLRWSLQHNRFVPPYPLCLFWGFFISPHAVRVSGWSGWGLYSQLFPSLGLSFTHSDFFHLCTTQSKSSQAQTLVNAHSQLHVRRPRWDRRGTQHSLC